MRERERERERESNNHAKIYIIVPNSYCVYYDGFFIMSIAVSNFLYPTIYI